jgi:hypothetical protein
VKIANGRGAGALAFLFAAMATFGSSPARASDLSNVSFGRLGLSTTYFRGDRLVGAGTTAPYDGVSVLGRFGITDMQWKWIGYDVDVHIGMVAPWTPRIFVATEGAVAFAPARWKGPLDGSLVLGVGGGFSFSRPVWIPGTAFYPVAFARLMLLPKKKIRFTATYRFTPITTDAGWVRAHDLELTGGSKNWYVGATARIDDVTVGDPERLYRTYWIGPTAGVVIR